MNNLFLLNAVRSNLTRIPNYIFRLTRYIRYIARVLQLHTTIQIWSQMKNWQTDFQKITHLTIHGKKWYSFAVEYGSFFRPCTLQKFDVHTILDENVGLLRLFPGITYELVKAFLQPPIMGVVLQSYGSGNIPTNRKDIIDALQEATTRGVIIVNTTQCMIGSVSDMYEAGRMLQKAGMVI